jgi:ABC-type nitrate/sulfonate/bicarbonate transport system permease component
MNKAFSRLILASCLVGLYCLVSIAIAPNSAIGFEAVKEVLGSNPNKQDWGVVLFRAIIDSTLRFLACITLVSLISIALLVALGWFKLGRAVLDLFCELFRTVPATGWALPISVLLTPWWGLYISVVLSTTPILTLGLYRVFMDVHDSPAYQVARSNGIGPGKILGTGFLPWLAMTAVVHVKTTFSLIFIIIIVIESVLQSASIPSGVGRLMGDVASTNHQFKAAAEIFLLNVLIFISVLLSSIVDFVNDLVKRKVY